MSTPFNYELDEARIRVILANAASVVSEEAWQAFDATKSEADKYDTKPVQGNSPIGIGISKNVVMSVFFVAGIGLFTLLLMNMINLKPKTDEVPAERAVKPEPKSIKPTTPSPTPKMVAAVTSTTSLKIDSLNATTTTSAVSAPDKKSSVAMVTNTAGITLKPLTTPTLNALTARNNVISDVKPLAPSTQSVQASNDTATVQVKKKRKKKREAEVLETIQTPSLLGSGTTEEPELK